MTMELSRRGFLTGMVAVAVIAVAPKHLLAGLPTLYGDLVHDDTAALQALLDGKDIIRDGVIYSRPAESVVRLSGGSYRTTASLFLRSPKTYIEGIVLRFEGEGDTILGIGGTDYFCITNCIFDRAGGSAVKAFASVQ